MLYCKKYNFMFITETWLHSSISSGLLDPHSAYHIFRKDHVDSHYGGVAVSQADGSPTLC